MKANFPFTQARTIAFALTALFTTPTFANNGGVSQPLNSQKSVISHGIVEQAFTADQQGQLKYVSLHVQSTDFDTFGTHMNLYKLNGADKELVHSQQVVVPSLDQDPFVKVWLTDNVNVDDHSAYTFEMEIPNGREVAVFNTGNGTFECGIDKTANPSLRIPVEQWTLTDIPAFDCAVKQLGYNTTTEVTAATVSQSFTACQDGRLDQVYINATMTSNTQWAAGLEARVFAASGDIVANVSFEWTVGREYIVLNFPQNELLAGEEYELTLILHENSNLLMNNVNDLSFFTGTMTVDGAPIGENLCLMATMMDIPVDTTDETTTQGSHFNNFEDWTHDYKGTPPSEIEELRHNVYPNPFIGEFKIDIDTKAEEAGTITLYNFMGKKVFEQKVANISEVKTMTVNPTVELMRGYYTLRIEYGDNIILDTVVKQ